MLRERIGPGTSIGFDEYLDLVLYHPEFGYYGRGRARVGWTGDFFTNVSVSSLFGEILAGQFYEVWKNCGRPPSFHLIEQGAHDGQLMADVLTAAEKLDWWPHVRPVLFEPLPFWRAAQSTKLAPWQDRLLWCQGPEDFRAECGVLFSNELIDALPFLRLRREEGRWWELRVTWAAEGSLVLRREPAPTQWEEALDRWPEGSAMRRPDWPEPYETEFRPAANEWVRSTARCLDRGAWLICDYGYERADFYDPRRSRGTLWCYQNHRRDEDALADPGDKDISAHVEFTSLAEEARRSGWDVAGFLDQHHFLVGAATQWLRAIETQPLDPTTQKKLRALQTLLHPDRMGRQFQFLVLQRGISPEVPPLPCCQHSRKRKWWAGQDSNL